MRVFGIAILVVLLTGGDASAWRHGSGSSFNGGRSQMNLSQLGFACCDFINLAKGAGNPTVNGGADNGMAVSPGLLDVNGYPMSLPAGAVGTRSTAIRVNPSERPNVPIVVRWTGTWTLTGSNGTPISNSVTGVTNAANAVVTVGSGHYYRAGQKIAVSGFTSPYSVFNSNNYEISAITDTTITLSGMNTSALAAYSGNAGTITNTVFAGSTGGRYVYQPAEVVFGLNVQLGFTPAGAAYVSKLEAMYVDEEALYDAGQVFSPRFINTLRNTLRVGKLRFLDWQGGSSGANTSNVTTWATANKPLNYISYAADYWDTSLWVSTVNVGSNPITSATGSINDYTINFGSGDWTDKQTLQMRFPSAASLTPTVVTFSGTVGSGDLVVNWTSHGFSPNTPINCFATGGGGTIPKPLAFATNAYVVDIGDPNSFKLSLTPGGAPVVRLSAGFVGNEGGSSFQCVRPATLSINGNAPVILRSPTGDVLSGSQAAPNNVTFSTVVFDADLNSLLMNHHAAAGAGIVNGVPPSLMFRLCKEVGAHCYFVSPYLAVDPMTDYTTQLMTACRDYAAANAPWMKCAIEGVNEVWNFGLAFNGTRYAWNKSYAHWPTTTSSNAPFDSYNWYGKIISTVGQATEAVFSNDRSKYEVILGLRTADMDAPSISDDRVNATLYVAQSAPAQSGYQKTPGYLYATHGVIAGYFGSDYYDYPQEMAYAYDYLVNGNAAAIQSYIDGMLLNTRTNGNIIKGGLRIAAAATYLAGPWGGATPPCPCVMGLQGYEGGYDGLYPSANTDATVTAATNDASGAVLTMPTVTPQGTSAKSNSPMNAMMVGMMIRISGASGGTWSSIVTGAAQTITITAGNPDIPYTGTAVVGQGMNFTAGSQQFLPPNIINGRTYWIVSVNAGVSVQVSTTKGGSALVPASGGTGTSTAQPGWVVSEINVGADPLKVRLDVDSSGLGTYTASTATARIINGPNYVGDLRVAVRSHPSMQNMYWGGAISNYKNWTDAGATFPPQYYLMSNTSAMWPIYAPSTYSTISPGGSGIAAFNYN